MPETPSASSESVPSALGNLSLGVLLMFTPFVLKLRASKSAVLRAESGVPLPYPKFLHP